MTHKIDWLPFSSEEGFALGQTSSVVRGTSAMVELTINNQKRFSDARVLVAEDDKYMRQTLEDILEFFWVDVQKNVVFAVTWKEIIEKIQWWFSPDLLLSDNHMPEGNGSDTIQFLMATGQINKQDTFVVMQTGRPDILQERKSLIWAHYIIGKPFDLKALRHILSERFV